MSVVPLVSGGLDSAVMATLIKNRGQKQYPLFIDYGQISARREWSACRKVFRQAHLPNPTKMGLGGYGKIIHSGLTNSTMDVVENAFLPGRNSLFLLMGAAFAVQNRAIAISIGLLSEATALFPDQTKLFVREAEKFLRLVMGQEVRVLTPMIEYTKQDVIAIAKELGIRNTYSCHAGGKEPCGKCIACREFATLEV